MRGMFTCRAGLPAGVFFRFFLLTRPPFFMTVYPSIVPDPVGIPVTGILVIISFDSPPVNKQTPVCAAAPHSEAFLLFLSGDYGKII